MAITKEELVAIREALDRAARPLVFFDDDCDGATSFLQVYQHAGEGKGVPVKARPLVTRAYARKAEEYHPDLIVILDKPLVEEGFFEAVMTPVLWIDHHQPQDVSRWGNVRYYNPRLHNDKDNLPVTYWVYKALGGKLWLATVGAVADWHLPDYLAEFKESYPDLLPPRFTKPEDLLFNPASRLGRLIRIISFSLKGSVQQMMKSVLALARVESPYEILDQTTPAGRYLHKRYERLATKYESLLQRARENAREGAPLLLFTYEDADTSLTADVSNELLHEYPNKLILIARKHEGEYKYSLRSAGKYQIPPLLAKVLEGVAGYGGGHAHACGACVKERDNERFIAAIKEQLGEP